MADLDSKNLNAPGPVLFIFMWLSGKIGQILVCPALCGWCTLWEILDPPPIYHGIKYNTHTSFKTKKKIRLLCPCITRNYRKKAKWGFAVPYQWQVKEACLCLIISEFNNLICVRFVLVWLWVKCWLYQEQSNKNTVKCLSVVSFKTSR